MRLSLLAVQAPLFLVFAGAAVAGPVTIDFTLTATEGSQFGVTAPAEITGAFVVDSSFLAQADGSYGGGAISDFLMQIGTQVYDQTTAFSPDIQGIELQNNELVGVAMNWEQTAAGLGGGRSPSGARMVRGLPARPSFSQETPFFKVQPDRSPS